MKILITTDYYIPEINGVVTSVINLKKGLEADGHEVRVLTLANSFHEGKVDDAYYIGSFSVSMIYPNARIAIPKNYRMVKEIINWKPDVIHSQCEFSTFVFAKHIAEKTGAPIVHTYHTVYEGYTHYFCPSKVLGKKAVVKFTREVSKSTNAFIVPTEKMYRMLEGYKVEAPMKVIPSGINLDRYKKIEKADGEAIRKKYGIKEDETVVLFLGRLAKEKNVDELINYMTKEKNEKVKLLIVGDGPVRNDLEELCKLNGLGNKVIFTGMVNRDEVYDYYAAADVFSSASTSETQGLTYMEAMASGLPILCRYDSCLDEVIDNEVNGYVYRNEEEFDKYLELLSRDDNLRRTVGIRARESIFAKYSVDAFVRSCEDLYVKCGA